MKLRQVEKILKRVSPKTITINGTARHFPKDGAS